MTVKFVKGDIFKIGNDYAYTVLVNPVNCVGVMGAGLALEFKKRFPENFDIYRKYCIDNKFDVGEHLFVECGQSNIYIINLATKKHWQDKSTLFGIRKGLRGLVSISDSLGGKGVFHVPELGCGLGGLNFKKEVKPLMEDILGPSNGNFTVFSPDVKLLRKS